MESENTSHNCANNDYKIGNEQVVLETQNNNLDNRQQKLNGHNGDDYEKNTILNAWNWGAFCLPITWCFFYNMRWLSLINVFLTVVCFLALEFLVADMRILILYLSGLCNILIRIYIGFKGNMLSWRNKKGYADINDFAQSQKIWNTYGIMFMATVIVCLYYCL